MWLALYTDTPAGFGRDFDELRAGHDCRRISGLDRDVEIPGVDGDYRAIGGADREVFAWQVVRGIGYYVGYERPIAPADRDRVLADIARLLNAQREKILAAP